MAPRKVRELSEESKASRRINAEKAREKRKANLAHQKMLREKFGIESSDSDDTDDDTPEKKNPDVDYTGPAVSDTDSDEEGVIVRTVRRTKKNITTVDDNSANQSDLIHIMNKLNAIELNMKKKGPRKKTVVVVKGDKTEHEPPKAEPPKPEPPKPKAEPHALEPIEETKEPEPEPELKRSQSLDIPAMKKPETRLEFLMRRNKEMDRPASPLLFLPSTQSNQSKKPSLFDLLKAKG